MQTDDPSYNDDLFVELAKRLGRPVIVPNGSRMILVEIYSNGNVACIPEDATDYERQKKEYHADSIRFIEK